MVAKQEKKGFAQYSLRLGGEEIAQLSVTDLRSNPQAAVKFDQPDMMIEGTRQRRTVARARRYWLRIDFRSKCGRPEGTSTNRIE